MLAGNYQLVPHLPHRPSNVVQDKEMNMAAFGGVAPLDSFNVEIDWDAYTSAAGFGSMNDSMAGSVGTAATVSPKDIFHDPLASAPPSAAFTNLTSPSINESPYIGDSYDTSPIFQDGGDMSSQNWFSLFPEEEKPAATATPLQRSASNQSFTQSSSSNSSPKPVVVDASSRRKSNTNSPALLTQNAGVSKPRRRKGPLPPITVTDPADKVALKRARNTLAARESRQRKYEHVQELEKRIADLEDEQKKASDEAEKWKNIALSLGYLQS
ncbi:Cross-pathway control protein 1 [Diplodia seriata]|uniref:Cross-pathway control protein 1 n=1 Tax=Diplodia seriata TaxID=420778 RepID=A0A1S8BMB1_9PEZI|nr:Cross-pathway control protein 1 [Diplodia seriata]